MAYANLIAQACADKTEFFCRLRDFLCKRNGTYDYSTLGIGYTLHDSSYAVNEDNPAVNDWFVVKITGEDYAFDYYVRFLWTTDAMTIQGGLYWNATTHAFETATDLQAGTSFNIDETEVPTLNIWGDLDFFTVTWVGTTDTATYGHISGRMYPLDGRSRNILTATSTYTAGSDVSITFNEALPSDWVVNNKIFLWPGDGANVEIVTIKTVDAGTKTITVDLAANLATGTVRGARYLGLMSNIVGTDLTNGRHVWTDSDTGNQIIYDFNFFQVTSSNVGASPVDFSGKYLITPLTIIYSTGVFYFQHLSVAAVESSSLNTGDVLNDQNGDSWRVIGVNSSATAVFVVKEV